jgi:hypothetical protein
MKWLSYGQTFEEYSRDLGLNGGLNADPAGPIRVFAAFEVIEVKVLRQRPT